jgi:hypothetical protein
MVVFTSGIVDGQGADVPACLGCWWSGYSWPCVGGGWGQAHCWVLKDQPFWLVVLVLPLLVAVLLGWSWVLVGLLFEICIVDASIFAAGVIAGCE